MRKNKIDLPCINSWSTKLDKKKLFLYLFDKYFVFYLLKSWHQGGNGKAKKIIIELELANVLNLMINVKNLKHTFDLSESELEKLTWKRFPNFQI